MHGKIIQKFRDFFENDGDFRLILRRALQICPAALHFASKNPPKRPPGTRADGARGARNANGESRKTPRLRFEF